MRLGQAITDRFIIPQLSVENTTMKNVATVISAGLLVAASLAIFAADGVPYSGYGYGYVPPYGYAPYGYGVPVQPLPQPTAEQVKAMQEQQARAFEYMQNVQRQMAEYYANSPDPMIQMERRMFEQRNADMQEMNKLIQESNQDINRSFQDTGMPPAYGSEPALPADASARIQEMEKKSQDYRKAAAERRAAFLKAAEQRRMEVQKRLEDRRQEYGVPAPASVDAPKADTAKSAAQKS
jgi:hypothetical protein